MRFRAAIGYLILALFLLFPILFNANRVSAVSLSSDNFQIAPKHAQGQRMGLEAGTPWSPPNVNNLQRVWLWNTNNQPGQKWDIYYQAGYSSTENAYTIRPSANNNLCLAPVDGMNLVSGTDLTLWNCNNVVSQHWVFESEANGWATIRNRHKSYLCVAIENGGASNLDELEVKTCGSNPPDYMKLFDPFPPTSPPASSETGYFWNHPYSTLIRTTDTQWETVSIDSAADYQDQTVMFVQYSTNPYPDIWIKESDFGYPPGVLKWNGLANSYNSQGEKCADFNTGALTGNCDENTKKADRGTLAINSNKPAPSSLKGFLVRHELGHFFGMGHACDRVMATQEPNGLYCAMLPTTLQPGDIIKLNTWY